MKSSYNTFESKGRHIKAWTIKTNSAHKTKALPGVREGLHKRGKWSEFLTDVTFRIQPFAVRFTVRP